MDSPEQTLVSIYIVFCSLNAEPQPGAYMVIPGVGYESSSGGPFFRDIDFQGGVYL
jgi:hypothetical protein